MRNTRLGLMVRLRPVQTTASKGIRYVWHLWRLRTRLSSLCLYADIVQSQTEDARLCTRRPHRGWSTAIDVVWRQPQLKLATCQYRLATHPVLSSRINWIFMLW